MDILIGLIIGGAIGFFTAGLLSGGKDDRK